MPTQPIPPRIRNLQKELPDADQDMVKGLSKEIDKWGSRRRSSKYYNKQSSTKRAKYGNDTTVNPPGEDNDDRPISTQDMRAWAFDAIANGSESAARQLVSQGICVDIRRLRLDREELRPDDVLETVADHCEDDINYQSQDDGLGRYDEYPPSEPTNEDAYQPGSDVLRDDPDDFTAGGSNDSGLLNTYGAGPEVAAAAPVAHSTAATSSPLPQSPAAAAAPSATGQEGLFPNIRAAMRGFVSANNEFIRSMDAVVEDLVELYTTFGACEPDAHAAARARYEEHVGGDAHGDLAGTYNAAIPSVLQREFKTPFLDELSRGQPDAVAALCSKAITGLSVQGGDDLPHVCLHVEEDAIEHRPAPSATWDVDSTLLFPTTLAFLRDGLCWHPEPHFNKRITASTALRLPIPEGRTRQPANCVELQKLPHAYLGESTASLGGHNLSVYIVFSASYNNPNANRHPTQAEGNEQSVDRKFTGLNQQQWTQWTDGIFIPCLCSILSANDPGLQQRTPQSFEAAQLANSIRRRLSGVKGDAGGAKMDLAYNITHAHLDQLWTRIVDRCALPGNDFFAAPVLYATNMDTKSAFRTQDALTSMRQYLSHLERVVDIAYVPVDRLYPDLAREITPPAVPQSPAADDGRVAETYLPRTCCMRNVAQHYFKDRSEYVRADYYPLHFLRDTANLRFHPGPTSSWGKALIPRGTIYSVAKTPFVVTKATAYGEPFLEEVAIDGATRQAMAKAAGAHPRPTDEYLGIINRSGKIVARMSLDSAKMPWSIRCELRLSLATMLRLRHRLRKPGCDIAAPAGPPAAAWGVPSSNYMAFMYHNANKFAFAFMFTWARYCRPSIIFPHTQFLILLLRSLRFFMHGGKRPYTSEYALAKALIKYTSPLSGEECTGSALGMQATSDRCGYGFWQPVVRWDRMRLRQRFVTGALVGSCSMLRRYLRRHDEAASAMNAAQAIGEYQELLGEAEFAKSDKVVQELLWLTVLAILWLFHGQLMHAIEQDQWNGRHPKQTPGLRFCFAVLRQHRDGTDPHLKGGSNKGGPESYETWFGKFFGPTARKFALKRDFFLQHDEVCKWLEDLVVTGNPLPHRSATAQGFTDLLRQEFARYFWMLPNPEHHVMSGKVHSGQKNGGQRIWIALQFRDIKHHLAPYTSGRPIKNQVSPQLPELGEFTGERLQKHLADLRDTQKIPVSSRLPFERQGSSLWMTYAQ